MSNNKPLIYKSDARRAVLKENPASAYCIDNIKPVDAVEVVHGRWVDRWGGKYANPHYECSVCKKSALYKCNRDVLDNGLWLQDLSDYCPNCGAKMDLED